MPTEDEVRHVLWWCGDQTNGYEPGGFATALMGAIVRADVLNLARLARGFPGYVSCYRAWYLSETPEQGIELLRQLLANVIELRQEEPDDSQDLDRG